MATISYDDPIFDEFRNLNIAGFDFTKQVELINSSTLLVDLLEIFKSPPFNGTLTSNSRTGRKSNNSVVC